MTIYFKKIFPIFQFFLLDHLYLTHEFQFLPEKLADKFKNSNFTTLSRLNRSFSAS